MMKKLCFIIFLIPLVIVGQGVFASSYMHAGQGYTTYSTSSIFLQNNSKKLIDNVCDYNQSLPENIKKIEDNPFLEGDKLESEHKQQKSTSPDSERHQKIPDWWRQPNSFQGWGFN